MLFLWIHRGTAGSVPLFWGLNGTKLGQLAQLNASKLLPGTDHRRICRKTNQRNQLNASQKPIKPLVAPLDLQQTHHQGLPSLGRGC